MRKSNEIIDGAVLSSPVGPEWSMEHTPDLVVISNANTEDGLLSEHRSIHWKHTKRSIELLGEYVVGIMPKSPAIEVISTAQNRTALTAEFIVRKLDETDIDISQGYIWKPGTPKYSDFRDGSLEDIVNASIRHEDRLTVLVGTKSTIRNYDPESFLDNYAQVVALKNGKKIEEIAHGYLV